MAKPSVVHQIFLGSEVTEQQEALYESSKRGLSCRDPDAEVVDATLVVALALAKPEKDVEYSKVFIYAPASLHRSILSRIHGMAVNLTPQLRGCSDIEKRKRSCALARNWLEALMLGAPKLGSLEVEPDRWVSIGYVKEDPLPEWWTCALI